jgi:hypothetical protein
MPEHLITSGRIVDVIIVLMAAEVTALAIYRRWTTRGLSLADASVMLLAGLFLLLALRVALTGADWFWIALFLFAALIAHLVDLQKRMRS